MIFAFDLTKAYLLIALNMEKDLQIHTFEFWVNHADCLSQSCSTALYLHNRSSTAALKDHLFGRRPDKVISNLRVFGCVSYVQCTCSR